MRVREHGVGAPCPVSLDHCGSGSGVIVLREKARAGLPLGALVHHRAGPRAAEVEHAPGGLAVQLDGGGGEVVAVVQGVEVYIRV